MKPAARLAFWLVLAAIAVFTLGPIDLRPESGLSPQVERFSAFLTVSVLFSVGYPKRRWIGWMALCVIAAALEILQNEVPGRHGRLIDFDAKAAGVAAGAILALGLSWLAKGPFYRSSGE